VLLGQFVKLVRGDEEVRISKRTGNIITLADILDEVDADVVRMTFLLISVDSTETFDLDVVTAQSMENPVYYVQYAHARICSALANWGGDAAQLANVDLSPLTNSHESGLLAKLAAYPEMLQRALVELGPHQVAFYLRDLAADLHSYYFAHKWLLDDDEPTKLARLALAAAIRQVLRNGLALIGVSAPEKM